MRKHKEHMGVNEHRKNSKVQELLYEAIAEFVFKGNYDCTRDLYCGEGDKEAMEILEACESEIRRVAKEIEEEIVKRVERVVQKQRNKQRR